MEGSFRRGDRDAFWEMKKEWNHGWTQINADKESFYAMKIKVRYSNIYDLSGNQSVSLSDPCLSASIRGSNSSI